jgi:hypothetical protein
MARDPGPGLVGAVELSYAVAALNIACRRDGEMRPAESGVGLFGKTGVLLDNVFVDSSGIVHGFLPVLLLMVIAILLPGISDVNYQEVGVQEGKR